MKTRGWDEQGPKTKLARLKQTPLTMCAKFPLTTSLALVMVPALCSTLRV